MGKPEIVVNSAWRSGFFSSVGRSVFSSQAFSFAEGLRRSDAGSAGAAVCVDALEGSLMTKLLPYSAATTFMLCERYQPSKREGHTCAGELRRFPRSYCWRAP